MAKLRAGIPPNPTRRLLHGSGVIATAALSGCSGLLDRTCNGGDDEPDAGTGSYGILLLNEMERPYTVSVEARRLFEDDPVFSETTEVGPDDRREWEAVLTEDDTQFRVEASIEDAVFYDQNGQNRTTVAVGTSSSPDVETWS